MDKPPFFRRIVTTVCALPRNDMGGLVMEQPHAGEGHDNAIFVALFNDQIVPDGAAGLGDIAAPEA